MFCSEGKGRNQHALPKESVACTCANGYAMTLQNVTSQEIGGAEQGPLCTFALPLLLASATDDDGACSSRTLTSVRRTMGLMKAGEEVVLLGWQVHVTAHLHIETHNDYLIRKITDKLKALAAPAPLIQKW